jgi:hypothetical protein
LMKTTTRPRATSYVSSTTYVLTAPAITSGDRELLN